MIFTNSSPKEMYSDSKACDGLLHLELLFEATVIKLPQTQCNDRIKSCQFLTGKPSLLVRTRRLYSNFGRSLEVFTKANQSFLSSQFTNSSLRNWTHL